MNILKECELFSTDFIKQCVLVKFMTCVSGQAFNQAEYVFFLISGTYNLCITVLEHIMYVINIVDKYVIRCNCPAVYMMS